ncbi:MAG TPA: tetratricopeptide repeat protein [Methylophilaceae bacterium]|jgi:uncharacterized protein (TIGR02466 family)
MKKQFQQVRQPSQAELQPLLNLLNSGQLAQAEASAKNLISTFPNTLMLHNILGIAQERQNKYEDAAASYSKALSIQPNIAEIHFNLGVVLGNLGKISEAITHYRKTINLKPNLAVAHFNLGTALQAQGNMDEAIAGYRKAIALEPSFFEALGNLGTCLQQQGKLEEAVAIYRKALGINPDARGHFNLATALRDQGKLDEAIAVYQKALAIHPNYVAAHNNLGEALRDQGKMQEAVKSYQNALAIDPANTEANFNIAQFLYDAGKFEEAIPYFEKSQLDDWQERTLHCLYKAEKFTEFKQKLDQLISSRKHTSPFLATLSTHYSTNFGIGDNYNFCKNAMEFVYQNRIEALANENNQLLRDLLRDINNAEIAERKQGRLHYGTQSAGNLFKRPEASFRALAELIKKEFEAYRQRFIGADCELIKSFPTEFEFTSSWYVKMQQGGHLTSHIHELGWLSGAVYLAMPQDKHNADEGRFAFGTHGDNYPQKRSDFPENAILPNVGDIILFPSSLFHRTIPFNSNEERICIAFDLKPAT